MAEREQEGGLLEEVMGIFFHAKVTKGGKTLSCAALVAVGDGRGRLGIGYGKARGVPMAIEKGTKEGRGSMMRLNLVGDTIAHRVMGRHAATRVLLMPASPGTGVKAGSTVRTMMRVAGVHNVLSKVFGNTNPVNVAKATMDALGKMRSAAEVASLRGREVRLCHPQSAPQAPRPVAAGQQAAAGT